MTSDEEAVYIKWRSKCVEKLQHKVRQNIAKRKKTFEDVVTNAVLKILHDNTLYIVCNPTDFKISDTIANEAVDDMCETISAWPGVDLTRCRLLPPTYKQYWRVADGWWNRQKGKYFGDLFFWHILHYSLDLYCKKILMNTENQIEYDCLFYTFLHDILHSKVTFKRARPNPLIFDLALEKSTVLHQWFSVAGKQHKVEWKIYERDKRKSTKDWVKAVKTVKFKMYFEELLVIISGYWRELNHNKSYSLTDLIHICFMYYFDQIYMDIIRNKNHKFLSEAPVQQQQQIMTEQLHQQQLINQQINEAHYMDRIGDHNYIIDIYNEYNYYHNSHLPPLISPILPPPIMMNNNSFDMLNSSFTANDNMDHYMVDNNEINKFTQK